jgi:hypothetical protein
MNVWASMLAQTPALLQRLIARTQRISLGRGCTAEVRAERLRRALCRQATVRAVYATLNPDERAALHYLRAQRGGLSHAALTARYGAIRPLRAMAADPRPQTIAERLLLLGWLLPRPPAPHHPPRYLVPPELRRWLPRPLALPTLGPAPAPQRPRALDAALAVLLLLAAVQATTPGLPLRADGRLRVGAARLLAQRLGWPLAQTEAVLAFVLPLLNQMGLVVGHRERLTLLLVGQRWVQRPPAEQLEALRAAWIASPTLDRALLAAMIDTRGIDWPLLRRRLVAWVEQLPQEQLLDPTNLYDQLSASWGPLGDAQTHGFRTIDRAPWQPRRAAAIWNAALTGPLQWLGYVEHASGQPLIVVADVVAWLRQHEPSPWQYSEPGTLVVKPEQLDGALLRLLPYCNWLLAGNDGLRLEITSATLTRALRQGHSLDALQRLLHEQAGLPPAGWWPTAPAGEGSVQLRHSAVLTVEPPELLARAARQRSVSRYLAQRPAPGIALVEPAHVDALVGALERAALPVAVGPAPTTAPPAELAPGDRAALLLACAFYRRHAPADAPLLLDDVGEQRLAAGLPPALKERVYASIGAWEHLNEANHADSQPDKAPLPGSTVDGSFAWFATDGVTFAADTMAEQVEPEPASLSGSGTENDRSVAPPADEGQSTLTVPAPIGPTLALLRQAMRRRCSVVIDYEDGQGERSRGRVVRPLDLERHGDVWYLRAYCPVPGDERTFRVDRVLQIDMPQHATRMPTSPSDAVLTGLANHVASGQIGAGRCTPDHNMRRLGSNSTDAQYTNALDCSDVEQVATHAVGVAVDHVQQLAPKLLELRPAQLALEYTELDVRAVALEQLHHFGAPLIFDYVVADHSKHTERILSRASPPPPADEGDAA